MSEPYILVLYYSRHGNTRQLAKLITRGIEAAGPDYGCLFWHPNTSWYYFQVSTTGTITIGIAGTGGGDVDFICWGPFTSPTGNCGNLTAANTVDCSYSGSATETVTINNAIAGE